MSGRRPEDWLNSGPGTPMPKPTPITGASGYLGGFVVQALAGTAPAADSQAEAPTIEQPRGPYRAVPLSSLPLWSRLP